MATTRQFSIAELKVIRTRGFRGRNAIRNRALFFMGVLTGFRISELLSLRRRDVMELSGQVRTSVTVEGRHMKGRKGKTEGRSVPLKPMGGALLKAWLNEMDAMGLSKPDMPVWINEKTLRPIGRKAVWHAYRAAARNAMVGTDRVGTHSTRKTFAWLVYSHLNERRDAGDRAVDPFRMTFKAMGHKRMETTEQYLKSVDVQEIERTLDEISAELSV